MVTTSSSGSTQKAILVLFSRLSTAQRITTKKIKQMIAASRGLMNQLAIMGTMPAACRASQGFVWAAEAEAEAEAGGVRQ